MGRRVVAETSWTVKNGVVRSKRHERVRGRALAVHPSAATAALYCVSVALFVADNTRGNAPFA